MEATTDMNWCTDEMRTAQSSNDEPIRQVEVENKHLVHPSRNPGGCSI